MPRRKQNGTKATQKAQERSGLGSKIARDQGWKKDDRVSVTIFLFESFRFCRKLLIEMLWEVLLNVEIFGTSSEKLDRISAYLV